jgi:hypothetical protein
MVATPSLMSELPASAPWIFGFVLAALVGFLATPLWIPLMRFLGATPARPTGRTSRLES